MNVSEVGSDHTKRGTWELENTEDTQVSPLLSQVNAGALLTERNGRWITVLFSWLLSLSLSLFCCLMHAQMLHAPMPWLNPVELTMSHWHSASASRLWTLVWFFPCPSTQSHSLNVCGMNEWIPWRPRLTSGPLFCAESHCHGYHRLWDCNFYEGRD